MKTFFLSDTHFTHANLMHHYPKGRALFPDVDALDDYMVEQFNSVVGPKDRVIHVGDFGGWDIEKSTKRLRQLHGEKELIPGNHDRKHIRDAKFAREWSMIHPYSYAELSVEGQQIAFSHFPIWEWMQIHRGWWHIHGHVHGKPTGIPGKILDVGVDGHDLKVWSFEEVKAHMDARPIRYHHEMKDNAH